VAIPVWVKNAIDAWMMAAGIDKGRLLRSISKGGKLDRDSLSDWAIWSIMEGPRNRLGSNTSRLRFKAYVREALPQGRWRPRADRVPARVLLDIQTT
jgi:hypothetical protein